MGVVQTLLSSKSIRFFLIASLLLAPFFSHAATLDISPAAVSVALGQTVSVRVFVSTSQSINAISGALSISGDAVAIDSVSKSGSILTLWVQDPSVSGSSVSWSGLIPNPGFTGRGQVVSIQLRGRSVGTATLSLASSEVLANDGSGYQRDPSFL